MWKPERSVPKMRICEECGAALDPGEVCDCQNTGIALRLQTAPVIYENLDSIRQKLDEDIQKIAALPKNDESLKLIRSLRAQRNKEFEAAEAQRKEVKRQVMAPYLEAEKAYNEAIGAPYAAFDRTAKSWVDDYENSLKSDCKDELEGYFWQCCRARGIGFLTFEQAGVKVDLALARQKTRKKAMNQIYDFVSRVAECVDSIRLCEHPEEILIEYKKTLSFAQAVFTVTDRHQVMKDMLESPVSDRDAATEKLLEERYICPFTVRATKTQLRALKAYMLANHIEIMEDRENE